MAAIHKYLKIKGAIVLNTRPSMPVMVDDSGGVTASVLENGEIRYRCVESNVDCPVPAHFTSQWVYLAMNMGLGEIAFTPGHSLPSLSLDREDLHHTSSKFRFVTDIPLRSALNLIALDALRSSGCSFGSINMTLKADCGGLSAKCLVRTPRMFYPGEDLTYENMVIKEDFPGEHMMLLGTLIASNQIRSGHDSDRNQHLAAVYGFCPSLSCCSSQHRSK